MARETVIVRTLINDRLEHERAEKRAVYRSSKGVFINWMGCRRPCKEEDGRVVYENRVRRLEGR